MVAMFRRKNSNKYLKILFEKSKYRIEYGSIRFFTAIVKLIRLLMALMVLFYTVLTVFSKIAQRVPSRETALHFISYLL